MHHAGTFDAVFLAMFCVCFAIRAPLDIRNRKVKAVESREGMFEKFCLMLVFTGSTTLPLLYLFTPWFDFADYAVRPAVGGPGAALGVLGVFLFWKSHRDLGRQFSPTLEVKEAHHLVSEGIYSRIRHPMYTAVFLIATAQLLLIGNAVVGPAFLLAFSILYAARIEHEEDMMLEHFGQAYADYKARTKRLLPSIRQ
ncbi:protein-S-isoprenylcysteine O-methyltransferase [Massilia orientalis]|jgi:protein-S-isoprenylcysteine O-methyltransferase Ste14|uniref:Protein-S-isoprenylcysteine O-methyltransferase n=1 Tax=Massilia orientalis TaxID=3050128 RepID=A0ACC7MAD6_9BURK|nr:protein-S-isoprenylcysteine O-methyltransferase [Massilia sp. YIM B02787]